MSYKGNLTESRHEYFFSFDALLVGLITKKPQTFRCLITHLGWLVGCFVESDSYCKKGSCLWIKVPKSRYRIPSTVVEARYDWGEHVWSAVSPAPVPCFVSTALYMLFPPLMPVCILQNVRHIWDFEMFAWRLLCILKSSPEPQLPASVSRAVLI